MAYMILKTETWTQEGYFNWEAHPEMDSVKEGGHAAGGDYTQVKEELLEYYRAKRETQNIGLPGEPNAQAVFFGYALEHNMYFHPTWKMLGNAFVNGQDQYISFDVSQLWSEIAASEDKLVSFCAHGLSQGRKRGGFFQPGRPGPIRPFWRWRPMAW